MAPNPAAGETSTPATRCLCLSSSLTEKGNPELLRALLGGTRIGDAAIRSVQNYRQPLLTRADHDFLGVRRLSQLFGGLNPIPDDDLIGQSLTDRRLIVCDAGCFDPLSLRFLPGPVQYEAHFQRLLLFLELGLNGGLHYWRKMNLANQDDIGAQMSAVHFPNHLVPNFPFDLFPFGGVNLLRTVPADHSPGTGPDVRGDQDSIVFGSGLLDQLVHLTLDRLVENRARHLDVEPIVGKYIQFFFAFLLAKIDRVDSAER